MLQALQERSLVQTVAHISARDFGERPLAKGGFHARRYLRGALQAEAASDTCQKNDKLEK